MFTGVGVALATLFHDDLSIDVDGTASHARRLVDAGAQSVTVAGSTGEAAALSTDEREQLIAAVIHGVGDDVPVLAGTGAPSARQAATLTAAARRQGVAGFVVLSPPRSSDPSHYYREVAKAAEGIPVLAYHFPAMSSPGVPVEALPDLGIFGIKDSSGDSTRLLHTMATFDGAVFVGAAALLVQAGATGCTGAILALANVDPAGCIAAFDGVREAQVSLHRDHVAVGRDWPRGIKKLMAERHGTSAVCRMG